MKDPAILIDRLQEAMPGFKSYYDGLAVRIGGVRTAFGARMGLTRNQLDAAIQAAGGHVGARPTDEHEAGRIVIRHPAAPIHIKESRPFAHRILTAVPSAYVDGSQIAVGRDINIPWGMVNISGSHVRPGEDLATHEDAGVITPADLDAWVQKGVTNPNHIVNLQRWAMEMRYLQERMKEHPGTVAVFDGSLVNSFAVGLLPDLRSQYDATICEVIDTSRQTESPLVGYTDTSRSRDLVQLLSSLDSKLDVQGITDSTVLEAHMKELGDRTASWKCDRPDGSLDAYGGRDINFHYGLFGPGGPCRIEYPTWVYQKGLHTQVHDVLLAQCLAYKGYPRSIDQAHVRCSIHQDEVEAVQRSFLALAKKNGIPARGIRKATSKKMGVRL
jgi:hypothetical protein